MRLTILGTGSARPVGDSAQSGILVEAEGTYVLFDIGAGILHFLVARDDVEHHRGAEAQQQHPA